MARWTPGGSGDGDASPWTDARPDDATGSRRRVPGDEWLRRQRLRRRAGSLLFAFVFVAGCAVAVFARGGYLDRRESRAEVVRAEQELLEQARRIRDLRGAIRRLETDRRALERVAREELNFVREGEISFLLLEDDPYAGEGESAATSPR